MALPTPRANSGENRVESGRRNVQTLLTDQKMEPIFRALLPKHFTPERMIRLSIMAVTRTPKLAECHPMTLLGAFIECAALGFEPNSPLQHVHLLPYWNSKLNQTEVNRIIGYRGFIDLAMRTGKVISLHADVAYQHDVFEIIHGTESHLRHVPSLGSQDRGDPLAAYCHVKLADGQAFDVIPWFDVLKIRARSPSVRANRSSPWDTDLDRMARKTAIRRLFSGGEAPMSLELAQATQIDERQMDYQALAKANVDEVREALESFAHRDEGDDQPQQIEQQHQERPTEIRTEIPMTAPGRPIQRVSATTADELEEFKRAAPERSLDTAPPREDTRQSWDLDGKSYVQPGRVANVIAAKLSGCKDIQQLIKVYNNHGSLIASLPVVNQQGIEAIFQAQKDDLYEPPAAAPTGDHPMSELDQYENENFRRLDEEAEAAAGAQPQQGGGFELTRE